MSDKTDPSASRPAKIPSRWYYAIGGFLMVATIAIFTIYLVTEVLDKVPDIRVAVPGSHEISFDHGGKYTLFYEYKSSIDGKKYSTGESLGNMWIRIEATDGTGAVQISDSSGESSYTVRSNRAGISLAEFEITHPGTYALTAAYQDGSIGPEVVFAIGKFNLVGTMLKAIGILALGLIIGSLAIVWAFIKRSRARKANNPRPEAGI